MHRTRHWGTIIGVIGFLGVVETVGLHIGLTRVSPVAAWIATGLSVYTLAWLALDYRALVKRPLEVADGELSVAVGLRWRVRVPVSAIVTAAPIEARPARAPDLLDAGVGGPNVLLTLAGPASAHGPFGLRREVTRLALTVDDRDGFLRAVRNA